MFPIASSIRNATGMIRLIYRTSDIDIYLAYSGYRICCTFEGSRSTGSIFLVALLLLFHPRYSTLGMPGMLPHLPPDSWRSRLESYIKSWPILFLDKIPLTSPPAAEVIVWVRRRGEVWVWLREPVLFIKVFVLLCIGTHVNC